jgi:hypothetical protein
MVCAAAAIATAFWIVQVGLFASRAPLSAFGTAVRFAIVAAAIGLLVGRRSGFERCALCLSVLAAGSSALCGIGVDRPAVRAVRLLSHVAAWAAWAIIALRECQATRRAIGSPLPAASTKPQRRELGQQAAKPNALHSTPASAIMSRRG